MRISGLGLLGALGAAGLMVGAVAHAQSAVQTVAVPPGYVAVMVPDGQDAAMAGPMAMLAQANAMMEQMQAQMQAQDAAMMQAGFGGAPMMGAPGMMVAPGSAGVVVTMISDGTHSCTQRIVYPGNGGQAKVQMTSSGNGCALEGVQAPVTPTALPDATVPKQNPVAGMVVAARDDGARG